MKRLSEKNKQRIFTYKQTKSQYKINRTMKQYYLLSLLHYFVWYPDGIKLKLSSNIKYYLVQECYSNIKYCLVKEYYDAHTLSYKFFYDFT